MTDDASREAAGDAVGGPPPAARSARPSIFEVRSVAPLTAEEQQAKEDAMNRALAFGARPVRDDRGWPLEVDFVAANGEAVEPWAHDPGHKRLYRRSQNLAKAAGQLIGQPGDRVEIAKRLALLHHREGSDIEGAVRRGLFDAIWRYDHVYDSFTVPRRYGTPLHEDRTRRRGGRRTAPQMAGRGPGPGRCLLGAQPPQHRPGAGQPQSRSGGG